MRNLHELDRYRRTDRGTIEWFGWIGDETCGAFALPSPTDSAPRRIVASSGDGWDHVSVSRRNRCPNWTEMEHVKRLFFRDDETAMQLHVPAADHVNNHPYCLHLWRPLDTPIPRPDALFIGSKELGTNPTHEEMRALQTRVVGELACRDMESRSAPSIPTVGAETSHSVTAENQNINPPNDKTGRE